jgi:NAD(P)-dependent dehydrogenase (short-subunit alcohol dehydrogenase family)
VVADLDAAGAHAVAAELDAQRPGSALGLGCNVGIDAETTGLIERTEQAFGPIDLFFANAGVALGTDLETPDEVWATVWAVNWQAHLFAARRLVPGWLARGEGYFCSTASAAGLLAQIGSVPYSVTKHAAVAFAEWLSITYGDRGVRVSCLCPMGVNTNMLAGSLEDPAAGDVVRATSEVLEPEEVAEVVVRGIAAETFLLLPHPEVAVHLQRKAGDPDRWLRGMQRLRARVEGGAV